MNMPPGGHEPPAGTTQEEEWRHQQRQDQNYGGGGGGGNGCFPANALVHTPNGRVKIQEIDVGDTVLTYCPVLRKSCIREVTKKLVHPPDNIMKVTHSKYSGQILTTSNHRFLTPDGWTQAKDLKEDSEIFMMPETISAKCVRVSSVEILAEKEPVYNLYTALEHTYIVDGCIVHNFTYFLVLRTWWHRTFIDRQGADVNKNLSAY
jgi:hypothetical protein